MKTDQASNTAVIVAAGLQLLHHDDVYRSLLPLDVAGQGASLLRAVRPRLSRLLQRRWFRAACHWLEQRVMPGILLHYALRKRALQQYARQSIEQGVTQVVVLGAGFDTICARLLLEFPALCCIEVDHPATQRSKLQALGAEVCAYRKGDAGLHYVALDLAQQELAQALTACPAFDAARPTLFIAEGLLMYLTEPQVASMLRQLQAIAPQNRLAMTWFDSKAGFVHHSRWLDLWLSLRNEPFLSGVARERLPRFLADCGYAWLDLNESAAHLTPAEKADLPANSRVLCGEYICLAKSVQA
jgi:methyltransferase (TIGR00027 family)